MLAAKASYQALEFRLADAPTLLAVRPAGYRKGTPSKSNVVDRLRASANALWTIWPPGGSTIVAP